MKKVSNSGFKVLGSFSRLPFPPYLAPFDYLSFAIARDEGTPSDGPFSATGYSLDNLILYSPLSPVFNSLIKTRLWVSGRMRETSRFWDIAPYVLLWASDPVPMDFQVALYYKTPGK